eukprot:jgi/Orpsp1_1/1183975/evm.model.c7180000087453.1
MILLKNLLYHLKFPVLYLMEKNFQFVVNIKITLNKDTDTVTADDFRFDKIFSEAYKEVYNKELEENKSYYEILNDKESDKFYEKLIGNNQHKILSYPYFTQTDPHNEKYNSRFDTLLFQFDLEDEIVIWSNGK